MPDTLPSALHSDPPWRGRFAFAWATTLAVLLVTTWPLWTPQRSVPRVAPFAWQGAIPTGIDWILLVLVAYGIVRSLTSRALPSFTVLLATAALFELMSLDQLRWQPWAYHAVIAGVVLGLAPSKQALNGLRGVAIAVYTFSAIAKLDAEFAASLGQQMLGVLSGGANAGWSETTRTALALALPASELALAGLLVASLRWKRLAKWACIAATLMHATTIGVLSPWGLGHSLGVLLWNAGFAWQTVVLFWPSASVEAVLKQPARSRLATAALVLGIVVPLSTPLGFWDQWPGWALYAPGGERATLLVHSAAVDRLPEPLHEHVDTGEQSKGPWRRVRLDEWLLAETGAPIYPQNRIIAAFAKGLQERSPMTNRLRLAVESSADRLTGERGSASLTTTEAIVNESRLLGLEPAVVWPRRR